MKNKQAVRNCVIASLIIIVFYFVLHHRFDWRSPRVVYTHLSNAFSIAGVLLLLSAGEGWLRKQHILDWPGYAVYQARFLARRIRKKEKEEKPLSFAEYREDTEPALKALKLWPRFWIGLFLLALGGLFMLTCM